MVDINITLGHFGGHQWRPRTLLLEKVPQSQCGLVAKPELAKPKDVMELLGVNSWPPEITMGHCLHLCDSRIVAMQFTE